MTGIIGVIVFVVGIIWAILGFFLPFMVYYILQHSKSTAASARESQRSLANIERNIYTKLNEGR